MSFHEISGTRPPEFLHHPQDITTHNPWLNNAAKIAIVALGVISSIASFFVLPVTTALISTGLITLLAFAGLTFVSRCLSNGSNEGHDHRHTASPTHFYNRMFAWVPAMFNHEPHQHRETRMGSGRFPGMPGLDPHNHRHAPLPGGGTVRLDGGHYQPQGSPTVPLHRGHDHRPPAAPHAGGLGGPRLAPPPHTGTGGTVRLDGGHGQPQGSPTVPLHRGHDHRPPALPQGGGGFGGFGFAPPPPSGTGGTVRLDGGHGQPQGAPTVPFGRGHHAPNPLPLPGGGPPRPPVFQPHGGGGGGVGLGRGHNQPTGGPTIPLGRGR